jgi:hypothetical protein
MKIFVLLFILFFFPFISFTQKTFPTYNFTVTIDQEKKHLIVNGSLAFEMFDMEPTDSVKLYLHETMIDPIISLSSKKNEHPLKYRKEKDNGGHSEFTVYLPKKYQYNEELKIYFSYEGGSKIGRQFYFASDMLFAGGPGTAWYPQVIQVNPITKSGTLLEGTGSITISIAKPYMAIIAGGIRKPKTSSSDRIVEYNVNTPTFFTLCTGLYKEFKSNDKGFSLNAYLLSDTKLAQYYLANCSKVINYLSTAFGPYPYSEFSIIEFTEEISQKLSIGGGSTLAGIIMPSSSLTGNFNLALFGHELGHQWWGNKVKTSGSKGRGMLDEAMAQYGALLTVEKFDTSNGAEAFRRKGYPGYINNQSGFGYLKYALANQDAPLSFLPSGYTHTIGDSKGFLVYDILSRTIGRAVFFKALKNITERYAYISWDEFLLEIENASNQKLAWFNDQWFNQKGVPDWEAYWKQSGDSLHIEVTQKEPYYRIDNLELDIISKDNKILQRTIAIHGQKSNISIPVNFEIREVKIDPYFKILHWDKAYKEEALALLSATMVQNERIKGNLNKADSLYQEAVKLIPTNDKYGLAFSLEYEIARIKTMRGDSSGAIKHFLHAIQLPVRGELLPWAYFRLAELAKKVNDQNLFVQASNMAISADAVIGNVNGMKEQIQKLKN